MGSTRDGLAIGTRLYHDGADLGVVEERHRRVLTEHPLLPMAELLTAGDDWPLGAAPLESALFYAQSWGLVHYLVAGSGAEGHRRLASYLGPAFTRRRPARGI